MAWHACRARPYEHARSAASAPVLVPTRLAPRPATRRPHPGTCRSAMVAAAVAAASSMEAGCRVAQYASPTMQCVPGAGALPTYRSANACSRSVSNPCMLGSAGCVRHALDRGVCSTPTDTHRCVQQACSGFCSDARTGTAVLLMIAQLCGWYARARTQLRPLYRGDTRLCVLSPGVGDSGAAARLSDWNRTLKCSFCYRFEVFLSNVYRYTGSIFHVRQSGRTVSSVDLGFSVVVVSDWFI